MSEVKRWKLKGFLPGVEGECKAVFQPTVVMADDFDRVTAELDAALEELCARAGTIGRLTGERDTLRAENERLLSGFYQQVTDADLKKISDYMGNPDMPRGAFLRRDAYDLANMTTHMCREVQALRAQLSEADQAVTDAINARGSLEIEAIKLSAQLAEAIGIIGKWKATFGEAMARRASLYVETDAFLSTTAKPEVKP